MAAPAPSTPGHSRILKLAARSIALAAFVLGALAPSEAARWEPIPADELATDKPRIDPEAGAEILFRETIITHEEVNRFVYEHRIRAKIFSDRGIEHFAKIDLAYDHESEIRDIAVRTVTPAGQTLELTKKDIYDREVSRTGKKRLNVRSFSPAGLQPGAIIEYTYTEIRDGWRWYVQMYFQGELP